MEMQPSNHGSETSIHRNLRWIHGDSTFAALIYTHEDYQPQIFGSFATFATLIFTYEDSQPQICGSFATMGFKQVYPKIDLLMEMQPYQRWFRDKGTSEIEMEFLA